MQPEFSFCTDKLRGIRRVYKIGVEENRNLTKEIDDSLPIIQFVRKNLAGDTQKIKERYFLLKGKLKTI